MTTTENRLLVHDGTFAALSPSGDITGAPSTSPDGLFRRDARHLSRWQLTLDGAEPAVLVPVATGEQAAGVLTPAGVRGEPARYTVFREQAVCDGTLVETLRLTGNTGEAVDVTVAITADADFADQFELRADHNDYDKPGADRTCRSLPDGVEFGYRRSHWHSRTTVTAHPRPEAVDATDDGARRLRWTVPLEPHGTAELALRVSARPDGAPEPPEAPATPAAVAARTSADIAEFTAAAPDPAAETEWPELRRACEQGLTDLAGLRVPALGPDGEELRVPGAGVPWFLTIFGRDSLLTSLFALPYRPELAEATLPALAAVQATSDDPARAAQPGKIVHEIRHGELAAFGQVPFGRYYGTVDATPLFLVLLGAFTERTGDERLARRLERHARAAVTWMERHGGLDERGYLLYRADEGGLANQNWKDSPGAICRADGTQAEGAIAVAEAQGYAYDALRRTARLARTVWSDTAYADRLDEAADDLKERFARDFWLDAEDFPALALDGEGRRMDALGSDAGHLLWSGILGQERGERVGRRLLEPDFFSGWGVRTLAAGQAAYQPLSYHRGSVWPHDNAVIALGLARYGLGEEVRRIAEGVVAAAARTGYRLPEVMAGYGPDEHPDPVPYPHSCSPQSWAAATPLALLTALRDTAQA
ncbi:amylo-alpha-1,6-glucosidase [Streptomyces meridianus]|uniref:Aminotransferase n=1 Tax=Streptomyces meridianus TaxID=2938945 RepID=A0ABT0X8R0_9ACTN|nr:glycogen debranching N-terminal domain-containing protein [Streptomyces meridianus]MCM2578921.1 aminotransferase [Streptomyces meridianus]